MMNESKTHKIVVGGVLATAFVVGISAFVVSAKHDEQIARTAQAAAEQSATEATAPDLSAPTQPLADATATSSSAVPDMPAVVAPAPTAPVASDPSKDIASKPVGDASKKSASKASDDRTVASTRSTGGSSEIRVASIAPTNRRSAESVSDKPSMAPDSATEDALPAPAQTGQQEATSASPAATSNEPVASDGQITAAVKAEIAAAAPDGSINITTMDGVVALAGSVPSQDAVEQARRAARGVAGVKFVDVSALLVSNQ